MLLDADEIYFHADEDGCAMAAFKAANGDYVILTRDLEPTEQDVSLGHDGVHLEVNEQGWSCYNGIATFSIYAGMIEISLNAHGADAVGHEKIKVRYDLIPERRSHLRLVIRDIFEGFPNFADLG